MLCSECRSSPPGSWHPALAVELLSRWAYSTCPKLAGAFRLKASGGGLGCVQENCSGSLGPQTPFSFQGKKARSWKKGNVCLLAFLSTAKGLDPKLVVLFALLISVPQIRSFFPHDSEGNTCSLWFSADIFVYSHR